MKQSLFSSIALFSILILVGVGCAKANTNQSSPSSDDDFVSEDLVTLGSIQEAIAFGKSLECTWSSEEGSGKTLVKGNKSYSKVTMNDIKSYIIGGEDECTYVWNDQESEGAVFCPTDLSNDIEDLSEGVMDFESNVFESDPDDFIDNTVDFDCRTKNIPDSTFDPPSDINFVDPLVALRELGF